MNLLKKKCFIKVIKFRSRNDVIVSQFSLCMLYIYRLPEIHRYYLAFWVHEHPDGHAAQAVLQTPGWQSVACRLDMGTHWIRQIFCLSLLSSLPIFGQMNKFRWCLGQLILPECMKLLPLYTNCLLKSDAIAGGSDLGCDDRAFAMSTVSSMDVTSSVVYFYPRSGASVPIAVAREFCFILVYCQSKI